MTEIKGMSPEAIDALLNKTKKKPGTTAKEPTVRQQIKNKLPKDPLIAKQIGPIVFVDERGYCTSGHWSEEFNQRFECKVPTYTQFQGRYYCNMHALILANQMLVAKGVIS